jgi:hypothetical protein
VVLERKLTESMDRKNFLLSIELDA